KQQQWRLLCLYSVRSNLADIYQHLDLHPCRGWNSCWNRSGGVHDSQSATGEIEAKQVFINTRPELDTRLALRHRSHRKSKRSKHTIEYGRLSVFSVRAQRH